MRSSVSKLARVACRRLQTTHAARSTMPIISAVHSLSNSTPGFLAPLAVRRHISGSSNRKGITPDDKPREDIESPKVTKTPVNMTDSQYHTVADEYLERLLTRLEELQDQREDVDVEYSSGVMTVSFGPEVGTYVINKQPPNKQIWLSSPRTGPKRYDYVIVGDSQSEKQDTATGDWVYLRDGTTLDDLLIKELGIDLGEPMTRFGG
ncbi:Frataxin, mitochondrial [Madurella mycetomatis]|uniref:ferroxidase n=1 Tax=Madurella mycetomatis TaxID=100816 RepID=A0A175W8Z4_9PEZI|nr:Frataxin, mitochondrial [Madurella mycetomatis]